MFFFNIFFLKTSANYHLSNSFITHQIVSILLIFSEIYFVFNDIFNMEGRAVWKVFAHIFVIINAPNFCNNSFQFLQTSWIWSRDILFNQSPQILNGIRPGLFSGISVSLRFLVRNHSLSFMTWCWFLLECRTPVNIHKSRRWASRTLM